ncbi:SDR family NAD(P)-dependent oxidoreductase [Leucothrix arctica]|uniref:Short-chain dehydrogenase n=1 Tax=Leucothrix arctica TaxID=1481894 RepID=A0A317C8Y6_9GAMM|nr:SDR family NAD(P)-dependent oxidoreductase [Leucothrix arctica]PWQ95006.1 short-chain dehydrogenase [Leucothrix arctica]
MKTILITGATGGIGQALSLVYANAGVRLILLARQEQQLHQLSEACRTKGADVVFFSLDFKNTNDVLMLSTSIVEQFEIDLCISNAGLTSSTVDNVVEPWGNIEQLIDINLTAALAVVHPIVLDMQARKSGQVAYVSSLAAYYGMSLTPAYSASKAGLKAYAEAMRVLLKPSLVSVTLVTPGFVETKMSDQFTGSKPFMISPEQAAIKIKKGLDRHAKVISFPWVLSLGIRVLSCLPASIADRIMVLLRY